jgi:hypothetical protein
VGGARIRTIEVDGIGYQWAVRRVDPGHVVVRIWRIGEVRHRALEVRVEFDDPWLNYGPIITAPAEKVGEIFALAPVTSELTARLVRLGLAAGWQSESRGAPSRFTLDRAQHELAPGSAEQ